MTGETEKPSRLAEVRYLPVRADEPADGYVVTDEEYERLVSQKEQARRRTQGYRHDAVVVVRTVRTAATHPHTRTMLRHATYVAVGALYLAKRAWDARSMARWERVIRVLQDAGQHQQLIEALTLRGAALRDRHSRRMDWLAAPGKIIRRTLWTIAGAVALLLVIGGAMAYANGRLADLIAPIRGMADVIAWVCWIVAVTWGPLVLAAPWLCVLLLWHLGRRSGQAPDWVMPESQRAAVDDIITPSIVVKALRDLGIPELRKKIDAMDDAGAALLGPIRLAGCGVEVDVLLPSGATTTAEVQRRRQRLAENLNRHEHELYITIPPQPRTVRLWIADSGALDEPIGPSPLVLDSDVTADLYTGRAPWGEDLRGDAVALPLLQRHLLCTGLSNQGKALAIDTPIPTPSGWTTMGALRVDDQVFGIDGKPCNVTGAFDVMYDHPCYEVKFSDGTVIVADAEHLWYTDTAASRQSERAKQKRGSGPLAPHGNDQQWKREMGGIKTTEQIAATVRRITPARDAANHSVPVAAPLILPEQDLPIDSYVLGYWLGDGRSDGARITCGTDDLAHVIAELDRAGYHHRESEARTCWTVRFSTHPIHGGGTGWPTATGTLRGLGLLGNKHIPAIYLRASEAQRRALLEGLMDSDGTIGTDGVAQLGVTNKRLADAAAELIQSLGFKVKRQVKRVKGHTEESSSFYRVLFSPNRQIFRIKRKADRVKLGEQRPKSTRRYIVDVRRVESVPVRCIAVDSPDHLFLASRAFIATHNTAALRSLALWLALDPTVELRIADLKGIGDWHMFQGLATVLVEGPTDAHVIAATEMLERGVAEMERRIAALDPDEYPDGVTRDLARKKGSGFHPIVLNVDEAQVAFMCPARDEDGAPFGGKSNKSRFFMAARKILNQGRAVNVILWFGTQDPTDQNLPKLVREAFHIRSSLVLGTEEQARMAVGDKAVNGGAAPHKLRQGLDKGTLVVAGDGVPLAPGQASLTVRTHFIDGTAATGIAVVAKQRRHPIDRPALERPPARDLLADVVEVMDRKPRMRSEAVRRFLADEWPATYGKWSAQRFSAELKEAGKRTGLGIRKGRVDGDEGQQYIALDEVLDALDARAEQLDDTPVNP